MKELFKVCWSLLEGMHVTVALFISLIASTVLSLSTLEGRTLRRQQYSTRNEQHSDATLGDDSADFSKIEDASGSHFGKPDLSGSKLMMNPWISPLARKFRLMRLSRSTSPLISEYF
ncbi:hypothetical protein Tcan_15367 [Toxocara canis]|uniref:Uncharacterized protein n=1 Tax=Toxocara canis TaxID=6265 RepID=A0A0B2V0I2_TOXCA|nr:hypothetical protein Tcan_15367 [Toxocara canis]